MRWWQLLCYTQLCLTRWAYAGLVYNQLSNSREVSEDAAVNTLVGTFTVTGAAGNVTYSLTEDATASNFFQYQSNGKVVVMSSLDREFMAVHRLVLKAVDDASTGETTTTTLTVFLKDVNDNAPVFEQTTYLASLSETLDDIVTVLSVTATDVDESLQVFDPNSFEIVTTQANGLVSYSILAGNSEGRFEINCNTGLLQTTRLSFDREIQDTFVLTVVATDGGVPALQTNVSVTITITDVNDNAPIFTADPYQAEVMENCSIGTVVMKSIRATDADIGVNGELKYAIIGGNELGRFALDADSAKLTVAGPIDYETHMSFTLLISVSDKGSPSLSALSSVVIQVLDSNDNAPAFFNSSTYARLELATEAVNGMLLAMLQATDADSGLNGEVWFSLVAAEPAAFTVSADGRLEMAGPLDREEHPDAISIEVMVLDRGTPSLNATLLLSLTLLDKIPLGVTDEDSSVLGKTIVLQLTGMDETDNVALKLPCQPTSFLLLESIAVNTLVTIISTTDSDERLNAKLEVILWSGNEAGHFSLDSTSGHLTVVAGVDFEHIQNYTLTVRVLDQERPQLHVNHVIEIALKDVNDNAPVFSQASYGPWMVEENLPAGTVLGCVCATDADSGQNSALVFQLNGSETLPFVIHATSGQIALKSSLDFEFETQYNLTVRVFDSGNPSLAAEVTVFVSVVNLNDLAPVLLNTALQFHLTEFAPVGTFITRLQAVDPDGWDFIRYTIVGDNDGFFHLDPVSGNLSTATEGPWDRELKSQYEIIVCVRDDKPPKGLVAFAELFIFILDENDNVPAFVDTLGNTTAVYQVMVPGNLAAGNTVLQVQAIDPDLGPNGTVVYTLDHRDTPFVIDATSGIVTVAESLYQHPKASFELWVTVADQGSPPLTGSPAKIIVVLDGTYLQFSVSLCAPSHQENAAPVATEFLVAASALLQIPSADTLLLSLFTQESRLHFNFQVFVLSATNASALMRAVQLLANNGSAWLDYANKYSSLFPGLVPLLASCTDRPSLEAGALDTSLVELSRRNFAPKAVSDLVFVEDTKHINLTHLSVEHFIDVNGSSLELLLSNFTGDGFWFEHMADGQQLAIHLNASFYRARMTSFLQFVPSTMFYGAVTFMARAIGYGQPVPEGEWQPFSVVSEHSVQVLGLVFPTSNEQPYLVENTTLQMVTIFEDSGVDNDATQVNTLGEFRVPPESERNSNILSELHPLLQAAIPAQFATEFNLLVASFNRIVQHRVAQPLPGIAVAGMASGSGAWQYSMTMDPLDWQTFPSELNSEMVLLLPGTTRVRFIPSRNFWGPASFNIRVWDGAQRSPTYSDIVNVAELPSALSSGIFSVHIYVEPMNDRPTVNTLLFAMPLIPYHISEALFYTSSLLVSVGPIVDPGGVEDRLTIAIEARVRILDIRSAANRQELLIQARNFSDHELIPAEKIVKRLQIQLSLLNMGVLPFIIEDVAVALTGMAAHGNCSQAYANPGTTIAALLGDSAEDIDGDKLGLALVAESDDGAAAMGVWQYVRVGQANWTNLPTISLRRALPLQWLDRLRFVPANQVYVLDPTVVWLQAKIWDGSISPSAAGLLDTVDVAPTSAFSSQTVTLSVSRLGCDGHENSGATFDTCCECHVNEITKSSCPKSCAGQFDVCGVCGGDGNSCLGCDQIPHSGLELDECGVCNGNNRAKDCMGLCFGQARLDDCGACTEGTTGLAFNYQQDCSGLCGGLAEMDACNICTGGTTGLTTNFDRDCNFVCGGSFYLDDCQVCQNPLYVQEPKDCFGACFGTAVLDDCGVCVSSVQDSTFNAAQDACDVCRGDNSTCTGCDGRVNSGLVVDACGQCGGSSSTCFSLQSVTPAAGPRIGGTVLTIRGTGLRSTVFCVFRSRTSSPLFLDPTRVNPINGTHGTCVAPATLSNDVGGYDFFLDVNGVRSNTLHFIFYDLTTVSVTAVEPAVGIFSVYQTVSLKGNGFANYTDLSCALMADDQVVTVPGFFRSTEQVDCLLPAVRQSQQGWVAFAQNGQIVEALADHLQTTFEFQAKSPQLSSVSFISTLTAVLVTWDRPVRIAPESCLYMFDLDSRELLSGGLCQVQDTTKQLIWLSPACRVYPLTWLTLQHNAVFTFGQNFSHSATGSVQVANLEAKQHKPIGNLQLPTILPACGSFEMSAELSAFAGYLPLRYYWSVETDDMKTNNFYRLGRFLKQLPLHQALVTVDAALIERGVRYLFKLQVENFLMARSLVARASLEQTNSIQTLDVRVEGPTQRRLGNAPTRFYAQVQRPSCLAQWQPLIYKWTLNRCLTTACHLTSPVDIGFADHEGRSFMLQPQLLEPGAAFSLTVAVRLNNTVHISFATVRIEWQPEVPRCRIVAPHVVVVGRTFELDARLSKNSVASQTYRWSCLTTGDTVCFDQAALPAVQVPSNTDVWTVMSSNLGPGEYVFSVTITRNRLRSVCHHKVLVTAMAQLYPSITLARPQVQGLAHRKLELLAWVSGVENATATWSCRRTDLPQTACFASSASVYLTGLSHRIYKKSVTTQTLMPLVVAPHMLLPGGYYEFSLKATNEANMLTSTVIIPVSVPLPPSGILRVRTTQHSRTALLAGFELIAEDWENNDGSGTADLLYTFYCRLAEGHANRRLYLSFPSLSNRVQTILPYSPTLVVGVVVESVALKTQHSIEMEVTVDQLRIFNAPVLQSLLSSLSDATKTLDQATLFQVATVGLIQMQNVMAVPDSIALAFKTAVYDLLQQTAAIIQTETYYHKFVFAQVMQVLELLGSSRLSANLPQEKQAVIIDWLVQLVLLRLAGERSRFSEVENIPWESLSPVDENSLLALAVNLLETQPLPLNVWNNPHHATLFQAFFTLLEQISSERGIHLVLGETSAAITASIVTMTTFVDQLSRTNWGGLNVTFDPLTQAKFVSWDCDIAITPCNGLAVSTGEIDDLPAITPTDSNGGALVQVSKTVLVHLSNPSTGTTVQPVAYVEVTIVSTEVVAAVGQEFHCLSRTASALSWVDDGEIRTLKVLESGAVALTCRFSHTTYYSLAVLVSPTPTTTTSTSSTIEASTSTSTRTDSSTVSNSDIATSASNPGTNMTVEPANSTDIDSHSVAGVLSNDNRMSTNSYIIAAVVVALVLLLAMVVYQKRREQVGSLSPKHASIATTTKLKPQTYRVEQFGGSRVASLCLGTCKLVPSAKLKEIRLRLIERLSVKNPGFKFFYFQTSDMRDLEPLQEKILSIQDAFKGTIFVRTVSQAGSGAADLQRQFCICGCIADFECSHCEAQGYCSRACQEAHWPEHHSVCVKPVTVSEVVQLQPKVALPMVQGVEVVHLSTEFPMALATNQLPSRRRMPIPPSRLPPNNASGYYHTATSSIPYSSPAP